MRKLEIEDIKKLSFEVLCEIKRICEANGLTYSLTGGTLIGAVRHGGFIPWDDDIDIMMPRPDYDRFIEIVKNSDCGFNLFSYETHGDDYWYPFAKACHKNTKLVENATVQGNVELGVYVDIFPVDGVGNSYPLAKTRVMMFQLLHGLKVTSNWTKYRKSKLRKWYYEPFRFICYVISKMLSKRFINRTIDKFVRRKPFEECRFAARLVGDYGSKEIMPKELFESYIDVMFEGEEFSAVSDYDTFLKGLYGDYMQLPPKEKQVTHHEFLAYWVD